VPVQLAEAAAELDMLLARDVLLAEQQDPVLQERVVDLAEGAFAHRLRDVDGANLGAEDTTAPYSVSWNASTASNGAHTLSARARDAAGNMTTSATVPVTVSTPPTLAIVQPAEGATLAGASVNVTYTASGDLSQVSQVQFQLDGGALLFDSSVDGSFALSLVPAGSQEDLDAHKYDWRTAWFPISEPIDKPMPGEKFEVQLFEKKNKLFGKIESDWKAN